MATRRRRSSGHKLIRAQQKVILDYMGVPMAEQPNSVKEINDLISKAMAVDPNKYAEAIDIIVHHRIPTGAKEDAKAIHFKDMGQLVSDMLVDYEGKAIHNIEQSAIEQIERMAMQYDDEAKRAIYEAAQKYNKIEIKVGNKKAVKMDNVILPEEFEQLVQLAHERVNILMVGPAGCGKTYVASLVAKALALPFGSQSCSAGVSESVFTGWLLPTGANGKFTHVMSDFLDKYENGGVFLLDELDASDANVLVFINQALANDGFTVPQRFQKPLVKKHEDFIAIAAANTYGHGADAMYHGRNALDAATLDRFKMGTVAMNYSPTVESKVVDPRVLEWGLSIRDIIAKHSLRKIMSTRVMVDATKMKLGQGWTIDQIAQSYFSDWSPEEKRLVPTELKLEVVA